MFFVNLTSILYLGAIAINGLLPGQAYLHTVMIGLAIFAIIITLGGMKVIGYNGCDTGKCAYHWWPGYYLYGPYRGK